MLALYFKCMMMMNLALPSLIILFLIVQLLCLYKRVYALSFAMHVFGMGIVALGVSGVKPAGEGVLGTLAGVSSKQPIWDQG
jgi:hypothetical protein